MNYYHGKCAYTIESLNQFYSIVDWCDAHNEVISVYLRLTSGNQFGMDEKTVEKIKKELEYLDAFCQGLEKRTGYLIEELEYGKDDRGWKL